MRSTIKYNAYADQEKVISIAMGNRIRLPSHIKPLRYKLLIKPDLEGFTFEGEEVISIVVKKKTDGIILHAKELEIYDASLKISNFQFPISKQFLNPKNETITFLFGKKIPRGTGELKLKFKGILNDKMRGFYRSHYYHRGVKKHIATTQFEATDARRAFPCFDEPAQKAIFDVTIMVPPGMTAISNTIPINIADYPHPGPLPASRRGEGGIGEHESEYKVVQFAPTPKMSTYLLAFIVGDFEWIEGWAKSYRRSVATPSRPFDATRAGHPSLKRRGDEGTLVRVFTTPGKKHQAKFALDCAVKTLEFYNGYFDIPYPLPVLDLIAIPDFSHGAMENWGAITYRENALLVDPEHSSASNKQWVALVIAHELAHQWFGNLVTMHWWTDLWLNEGFASYIEYLAVNHLFPKWDIWTQFAYNDLGVALKLDALKNTHPIEIEVHHPDEIGEIFDEVSYSKGASIIRMLANYLGEKDFRAGLRYYLKRHSYQNAETMDLWKAFEKISKKSVSKMMQNWTKKPGYPIVRVIQKPKGMELKQARFFSSPLSKSKLQADIKSVWSVPVSILNLKNKKVSEFLFSEKNYHTTEYRSILPLKINIGETGFYRVDYPSQMLEMLQQSIKNKRLAAIDRLGIIRDAFALAESGDLPTAQALELCQSYINENDYTVWVEIVSGLQTIDNLLYGRRCCHDFKHFARAVLSKIVKSVGWQAEKNESHTRGLLRSLILHSAGSFGEKSVVDKAKHHFYQWVNKNKTVNANLRGAVYSVTAENSGHKEHQFLLKKYISETLNEEKNRIGRALGQFKDDRLIKKTLDFALSKHVRYQDTAGIFHSAWTNPYGRIKAWEFTKRHWKTLLERFPSSGHMLNKFIKPLSLFTQKKRALEVKVFFKKYKAPGAKRTIEQVLEKIYSSDAWIKRDLSKIENWLRAM